MRSDLSIFSRLEKCFTHIQSPSTILLMQSSLLPILSSPCSHQHSTEGAQPQFTAAGVRLNCWLYVQPDCFTLAFTICSNAFTLSSHSHLPCPCVFLHPSCFSFHLPRAPFRSPSPLHFHRDRSIGRWFKQELSSVYQGSFQGLWGGRDTCKGVTSHTGLVVAGHLTRRARATAALWSTQSCFDSIPRALGMSRLQGNTLSKGINLAQEKVSCKFDWKKLGWNHFPSEKWDLLEEKHFAESGLFLKKFHFTEEGEKNHIWQLWIIVLWYSSNLVFALFQNNFNLSLVFPQLFLCCAFATKT